MCTLVSFKRSPTIILPGSQVVIEHRRDSGMSLIETIGCANPIEKIGPIGYELDFNYIEIVMCQCFNSERAKASEFAAIGEVFECLH